MSDVIRKGSTVMIRKEPHTVEHIGRMGEGKFFGLCCVQVRDSDGVPWLVGMRSGRIAWNAARSAIKPWKVKEV